MRLSKNSTAFGSRSVAGSLVHDHHVKTSANRFDNRPLAAIQRKIQIDSGRFADASVIQPRLARNLAVSKPQEPMLDSIKDLTNSGLNTMQQVGAARMGSFATTYSPSVRNTAVKQFSSSENQGGTVQFVLPFIFRILFTEALNMGAEQLANTLQEQLDEIADEGLRQLMRQLIDHLNMMDAMAAVTPEILRPLQNYIMSLFPNLNLSEETRDSLSRVASHTTSTIMTELLRSSYGAAFQSSMRSIQDSMDNPLLRFVLRNSKNLDRLRSVLKARKLRRPDSKLFEKIARSTNKINDGLNDINERISSYSPKFSSLVLGNLVSSSVSSIAAMWSSRNNEDLTRSDWFSLGFRQFVTTFIPNVSRAVIGFGISNVLNRLGIRGNNFAQRTLLGITSGVLTEAIYAGGRRLLNAAVSAFNSSTTSENHIQAEVSQPQPLSVGSFSLENYLTTSAVYTGALYRQPALRISSGFGLLLDPRDIHNCLIHAIANAAGVPLTRDMVWRIRTQILVQLGIPFGRFLEANQETIDIIMNMLNISGTIYINNLDNPHFAPLPIVHGGGPDIRIDFQNEHFSVSQRSNQQQAQDQSPNSQVGNSPLVANGLTQNDPQGNNLDEHGIEAQLEYLRGLPPGNDQLSRELADLRTFSLDEQLTYLHNLPPGNDALSREVAGLRIHSLDEQLEYLRGLPAGNDELSREVARLRDEPTSGLDENRDREDLDEERPRSMKKMVLRNS